MKGHDRITSYNVCYTKLLRLQAVLRTDRLLGRGRAQRRSRQLVELVLHGSEDQAIGFIEGLRLGTPEVESVSYNFV